MPTSGENVRFQLLVNGEVKGKDGLESTGVLCVILNWACRRRDAAPEASRSRPEFSEQDWIDNRIEVGLSGLDSEANEHVDWFNAEVEVGDEITVRLLPPGEVDRPAQRRSADVGGCSLPRTASGEGKPAESSG